MFKIRNSGVQFNWQLPGMFLEYAYISTYLILHFVSKRNSLVLRSSHADKQTPFSELKAILNGIHSKQFNSHIN